MVDTNERRYKERGTVVISIINIIIFIPPTPPS